MILPTLTYLVEANHEHINRTGGRFVPPDNLMNKGGAEWVLDAIRYPLYGYMLYPTLSEKASIVAFIVIRDHVFWDGNKRTAMSVFQTMFLTNGFRLGVANSEIIEIALRLAGPGDSGIRYEDFLVWTRMRISASSGFVQ